MRYESIIDELRQFSGFFDSEEYQNVVRDFVDVYRSGQVIGLAAGRMGYSLRGFIMRLNHLGFRATMIGDTDVPACDDRTLCVVSSSSGQTPSLVLFAKQALDHKARVVLFTSNKSSKLAELSDRVLCYGAKHSQQMMKTLYEQFTLIMFDKLAEDIRRELRVDRSFVENNHSVLE